MTTQAQAVAWLNNDWRMSRYLTDITGSGWGIDFDHYYGHQCADFPNGYSANFGWGVFTGNAWQFWTTASPVWQRVQDPQPGDVFVLDNSYNNAGGHTGGVVSVQSGRKAWTAVSQNYRNPSPTIGSPPSNDAYTDYKLLGFLRPPLTNGEDMTDLNTERRLAYWIYGINGVYAPQNALNGDIDTQLQASVGRDTNTAIQNMTDDQYGQAYKAWLTSGVPEATILKPGTYKVQ